MSADLNDPIIQKLLALGKQDNSIRAIILTSSRANGTSDLLSDYDLEIIMTNPARFVDNDDWFESFGPVLVMLRLKHDSDPGCIRLVQYQDGSRIDFNITAVADFRKLCQAPSLDNNHDIGYEVLLDKDGITTSLAPPTFRAFIPTKPDEDEFASVVNSFWWNSIYAPKSLWRGQELAAASWLDGLRQGALLTMLAWSVEIKQNWTRPKGLRGMGLEKLLDTETHQELISACGGGGIEDLWKAFFATISLFQKTAVRVAENLGYDYPHDLSARVIAYHKTISKLDPQTTSKKELARLLEENYKRPTT